MLVCFDPINIATTEPWVNPAIMSSEEIWMCASGPCDANMFLIRHKNILIVPILKYLRHRGELKLATHTRVAAAVLLLVAGLMKVFIWGAGPGAGLGCSSRLVITQYSAGILYNIGTHWVGARSEYIINVLCVY